MGKASDGLRKFWNLLFPHELEPYEYVAVFIICPTFYTTFYIKSCRQLIEIVHTYKKHYDIHINLSTVIGNRSREAEYQYRRSVIALDFDKKDFKKEKLTEFNEFIDLLQGEVSIGYHAAVDSGHGYHFYFGLEPTIIYEKPKLKIEPFKIDTTNETELERLERQFRGKTEKDRQLEKEYDKMVIDKRYEFDEAYFKELLGYFPYELMPFSKYIGHKIENITKALALKTRADTSAAISTQMMRVPFTTNFSKPNDIKPCKLITIASEYDYDNDDDEDDYLSGGKLIRYKYNRLSYAYNMEAIADERRKARVLDDDSILNGDIDAELDLVTPQRDVKQDTKPTKIKSTKAFKCVENMLNQGAHEGERNTCLGRIIHYYRYIEELNEKQIFDIASNFNSICNPPKDYRRFEDEFNIYWIKGDLYNLLGCADKIMDDRKRGIIEKFCDDCYDASNNTGEVPQSFVRVNKTYLTDELIKELSGLHYLIILLLYRYSDGLTNDDIFSMLTATKRDKALVSKNSLDDILKNLVKLKIITAKELTKKSKLYKIKQIPNPDGKNHYIVICHGAFQALLTDVITPKEFLTYIVLRRNCLLGISAAQTELAELLGTTQKNISTYIIKLDAIGLIKKKPYPATNGHNFNFYDFPIVNEDGQIV